MTNVKGANATRTVRNLNEIYIFHAHELVGNTQLV